MSPELQKIHTSKYKYKMQAGRRKTSIKNTTHSSVITSSISFLKCPLGTRTSNLRTFEDCSTNEVQEN
jgi:hypothetical protein